MSDRAYCVCCGMQVDVVQISTSISAGGEGGAIPRCAVCGYAIDPQLMNLQHLTPAAAQVPGAGGQKMHLPCVILAEDMVLIRNTIKELLIADEIADAVDTCSNGQEFISTLNARVQARQPVSLVIMDIMMPGINGLQAALTMRNLEGKFQREPTPIIFFSGVVCDEKLRGHMRGAAPAVYLNKGSSASPDEMKGRLRRIINRVINKPETVFKSRTR